MDGWRRRRVIDCANRGYFRFIYNHSRDHTRKKLSECFEGQSKNVVWLAVAVRHSFAHGELTPHADGVLPEDVVNDCDRLSDFLLRLMDCDFAARVDEFIDFLEETAISANYGPPD